MDCAASTQAQEKASTQAEEQQKLTAIVAHFAAQSMFAEYLPCPHDTHEWRRRSACLSLLSAQQLLLWQKQTRLESSPEEPCCPMWLAALLALQSPLMLPVLLGFLQTFDSPGGTHAGNPFLKCLKLSKPAQLGTELTLCPLLFASHWPYGAPTTLLLFQGRGLPHVCLRLTTSTPF